MNAVAISICCMLCMCFMVHGAEPPTWNVIIKKVDINNKNSDEAIRELGQLAIESKAGDFGFKGFLMNNKNPAPRRANIALTKIPLIVAVGYLADQCGFLYEIRGETIVIKNGTEVDSYAFSASRNIRTGLNLGNGEISPKELLKALGNVGFHSDPDSISVIENTVLITSEREDVAYLKAVITVMEKGFCLNPSATLSKAPK